VGEVVIDEEDSRLVDARVACKPAPDRETLAPFGAVAKLVARTRRSLTRGFS
jgi:hypothetical protein